MVVVNLRGRARIVEDAATLHVDLDGRSTPVFARNGDRVTAYRVDGKPAWSATLETEGGMLAGDWLGPSPSGSWIFEAEHAQASRVHVRDGGYRPIKVRVGSQYGVWADDRRLWTTDLGSLTLLDMVDLTVSRRKPSLYVDELVPLDPSRMLGVTSSDAYLLDRKTGETLTVLRLASGVASVGWADVGAVLILFSGEVVYVSPAGDAFAVDVRPEFASWNACRLGPGRWRVVHADDGRVGSEEIRATEVPIDLRVEDE